MKKTQKKKKVVVIGGGTGNFTLLMGLKKYPVELCAIVSMADNGGSSGILRDELGVLPPGDIRQCLVALSSSDRVMRELINYRFTEGKLRGHNFGNLLLSALEKSSGSFDKAIEAASEILRIEGKVIPVTLTNTNLIAYFSNGKVIRGEHTIEFANLSNLKKLTLEPKAKANPKAIQAIKQADVIVIAPGDFYQSIVPNFLVKGIPEAMRMSRAKKVYVCNLMTKQQHTSGFGVKDFVSNLESYMGSAVDFVIYNNKAPNPALIRRYAEENEYPVKAEYRLPKPKFIGADLLSRQIANSVKGDLLRRNLIRHDSNKIAKMIVSLL
ncbi:MAG: hypothetical protein UW08_C0019G0009 [Parcubacteria group bacterium GW2011_GWB1_43_8b]|nr:MAG: hypothetical protein UW08_C0019G0009 [Parcubacteria group bacterium GW2011_GWB1_43_8b]